MRLAFAICRTVIQKHWWEFFRVRAEDLERPWSELCKIEKERAGAYEHRRVADCSIREWHMAIELKGRCSRLRRR